jgi:hypothetical protein
MFASEHRFAENGMAMAGVDRILKYFRALVRKQRLGLDMFRFVVLFIQPRVGIITQAANEYALIQSSNTP